MPARSSAARSTVHLRIEVLSTDEEKSFNSKSPQTGQKAASPPCNWRTWKVGLDYKDIRTHDAWLRQAFCESGLEIEYMGFNESD